MTIGWGTLGTKSGWDVPNKIDLTALTPKPPEDAAGFEEASLTFVCKKIYAHKMNIEEVPEDVASILYADGNPFIMNLWGNLWMCSEQLIDKNKEEFVQ